jgi:hypothetical protein
VHGRAAEFDMLRCKPAARQLPIKLFEQQSVKYDANAESINAVLNEHNYAMQTEYFAAHVIYDEAEKCGRRCCKPANPEAVGRMVSVHPKNSDAFCLILLL